MAGRRAASRAENTSAIKNLARIQIADKGADNLSLREIAREMGMASSAMYRYFESRDQLLTELIIDAYDQLGEVVEQADASKPKQDLLARWTAMAHSIRSWSLAHPAEYGLIFGTPVPGYIAPDSTVEPGRRYTNALMHLLNDAHKAGLHASLSLPSTRGIISEYKRVQSHLGLNIPHDMLLAGLTAWAALLGAISFEIFGHVDAIFSNPDIHFAALTSSLGSQVLGLI